MNKSSVLRSRLNVSFGVISLFPIVSVLISIFYSVVYSFVLFFFREGSENILSDAVDFYLFYFAANIVACSYGFCSVVDS